MFTRPCPIPGQRQLLGLFLLLGLAAATAAEASEMFSATARVTSADGASASTPVTIVIDRFSTDRERSELLAVLAERGGAAARDVLDTREAIGWVQLGSARTPIKYAFSRDMGGGRLITAVTASGLAFLGPGLAGTPPREGYDFGLVLLETRTSGAGTGELAPAAKLRMNEQGAIVTEDASADVVRLTDVIAK